MSNPVQRVPTIHDLRVKVCYICHEEERHDDESRGQRGLEWVHPCKCTLIAHEKCLLTWIAATQTNRGNKSISAPKCAQCHAKYEIESDKPLVFRLLQVAKGYFVKGGIFCVGVCVSGVDTMFAAGVYVSCLSYGAWAARQFLGDNMYDHHFGDITNLPFTAYFNLPLLPLSLLASQLSTGGNASGVPLLLAWPHVFGSGRSSTLDPLSIPLAARFLYPSNTSAAWPPGPIVMGVIGIPIVKSCYHLLYCKVYQKVMGIPFDPNADELTTVGMQLAIHGPRDAANANANAAGGAAAAREPRNVNPVDNDNANADNAENGDLWLGNGRFSVSPWWIGVKIGGALLAPFIASCMGRLLFRLSFHSPLLRSFLGVRWPIARAIVTPPIAWPNFAGMSFRDALGAVSHLTSDALKEVSPLSRAQGDPVWWRNTVGLGLFVVVKDCAILVNRYYAKRELESRRVKNRDFAGIDTSSLDLVPEFYTRAQRP